MNGHKPDWRSLPRFRPPKAVCPYCGDRYDPAIYGNGRPVATCGKAGCLAECIRAYWKKLGYVATVKYQDGQPRLVGLPVKM